MAGTNARRALLIFLAAFALLSPMVWADLAVEPIQRFADDNASHNRQEIGQPSLDPLRNLVLASHAGGKAAAGLSPSSGHGEALSAKPAGEDLDYGVDAEAFFPGGDVLGGSVSILTGNAVEAAADLAYPSAHRLGLTFGRTYNSRAETSGILGTGWTHTYGASLTAPVSPDPYLKVVDPTGRARYFTEESTGVYKGAFNDHTRVLVLANGNYAWYPPDGTIFIFSPAGLLLHIQDIAGNRLSLTYDAQDRPATVSDPSTGRALTFSYNGSGLLATITGPLPNTTSTGTVATFTYDARSNLTSVLYADNTGFTYEYADANDVHNLTLTKNKADHTLCEWTYDAQDRCAWHRSRRAKGLFSVSYVSDTQVDVTDPYNWVRSYTIATVAGRKRVTAVVNPAWPSDPDKAANAPYAASNALAWTYDASTGNLTDVTFPRGVVNQYRDFLIRGYPQSVVLAAGSAQPRAVAYTWHPSMNVVLTRTEAGVLGAGNKETIFDYDDPAAAGDDPAVYNENPTKLLYRGIEKGYRKTVAGTVASYEYVTALTYDAGGQVLTVDGPRSGTGDTTTFAYDATTNDLLSVTRPLVGATVFSNFDAAGNPRKLTDVNAQEQTFVYDARGRIKEIHNAADSSVRTLTYNVAGFPATRTDEDGVNESYTYDNNYGQPRCVTDHEGNYVKRIFNAAGNLTSVQHLTAADEITRERTWSYSGSGSDYPGLLFKEYEADGVTHTRTQYDASGNVRSVVDPNGNQTDYAYDAFNRVISITRPGNVVTHFEYDSHGNLAKVVDPEGDPGNPALGHTTTYTYDDMGNLIGVGSPDSGTTTYGYRAEGTIWWRIDARNIQTTYFNDALYRINQASYPAVGDLPVYTVTYSHDQRTNGKGHLTTVTDPSGATLLNYDARGRLKEKKSTVSGFQFTLSRTFSPAGRVNQLTYPSGRTVTYSRAGCGCKLTGVSTTYGAESATTILENLTYQPFGQATGMGWGNAGSAVSEYDLNGRLTTANRGAPMQRDFTYYPNGQLHTIAGTASTPWVNRAYAYDALDRLSLAERPQLTKAYDFDDAGNRQHTIVDATVSETYAYLAGTNRLIAVTAAQGRTFDYDANGNTILIASGTNRVFTYDQENRLIGVAEDGNPLGSYVYNGFAQRAAKTAGGVTTLYLYDFSGNLVCEAEGTGGGIQKEYIHHGRICLAMADPGAGAVCSGNTKVCVYFTHNDLLGTPELMTDSTNTAVWEAAYDAFGEATIHPASTVVDNFRFPGQYYDAETGLHYNWHRYYDPKTGRYLTPDPIGLAGGINPYVYVENDPVNLVDPLGLLTQSQRQTLVRNWTAVGGAIGAMLGFLGGGGAGLFTGPGAVAAVPAGAYAGALGGAAIGGTTGLAIGTYLTNMMDDDDSDCESNSGYSRHGGGKDQVDDVAREFRMNRQQRADFGSYIEEIKRMEGRGGSDNLSYSRLRELAKEFLEQ